ncbi:hypothetical protein [Pendulispora albinea]|uniref:Uncharacterized protein n=1 Tax=Pendulispora albinea TaxID=2741071 RepID=A0ABZ2M9V5_9BACT
MMRPTIVLGLFTSSVALATLAAAAGLIGACSKDDDCSALLQCINNVNVHLRVALPPQQMREATIKVCRNDVCSSGKPEFLPTQPGERQKVITKGALTAEVTLDVAEAGKSYSISAVVPIDDQSIQPNKDRYDLQVRRNETDVGAISEVAKYEESNPNGPNCPSVCTNATIGTP